MIFVGIDPGVKTGLALWDSSGQRFIEVTSMNCIEAMARVLEAQDLYGTDGFRLVFEDARKRRWFGGTDAQQSKYGAGVREGAGSVKRDSKLWEEFCVHYGIRHEAAKPQRGGTKWKDEAFKRVSGWSGRTNEHARDAAMLVIGRRYRASVAEPAA